MTTPSAQFLRITTSAVIERDLFLILSTEFSLDEHLVILRLMALGGRGILETVDQTYAFEWFLLDAMDSERGGRLATPRMVGAMSMT